MNGYTAERKILTAIRLKALREERKLSHSMLAKQLTEIYKTPISRDVLINYEISECHHTKFETGFGMRVEYIANLADFYNVSINYLLGATSTRTVDENIESACKYTGIEESALADLHEYSNEPNNEFNVEILSYLIKNGYLQNIIRHLKRTLVSSFEFDLIYSELSEEREKNLILASNEFEFNKLMIEMYKDIHEKLSAEYISEIKETAIEHIENIKETAVITKQKMDEILQNLQAKSHSINEQEVQAAYVRKLIDKHERGQK